MTEAGANVFDEVMKQVGDSGKFQIRYNIMFNLILTGFGAMASFNPIISVATPDHWCHVPGRELTNYTAEEWKNLTIPRMENSSEFSQCTMFKLPHNSSADAAIIGCSQGWEYDQMYYTRTIATEENWVCQEALHATNLIVFVRVGEIVGTIFGQLGDVYGRRPLLYASVISAVVGRLGLFISKGSYLLYAAFLIFGSLGNTSIFQVPLVIAVEISNVADRTFIPLLQCIGWTAGLCVAPLVFWALGEWMPFMAVTTLPMILFIFIRRYMIESPRWLASKGKIKECVKELKKISSVNESTMSEKILTSLCDESFRPEKSYGMMTLFSSWSMSKKAIPITTGWICCIVSYIILYLNINNLKGNPFMNYFWQGIAELPGYFLGKYLCDAIGRKYTKFLSFLTTAIGSMLIAYLLRVSGNVTIITVCCTVIKFLTSANFYAISLQTIEIYPTCLRQTGYSIGFTLAGVVGIFAPYVTYLGTTIHPSLPYAVVAVLAVVGAVTGHFTPETLNERLPETVKEAERFGIDQEMWAFPKGHRIAENNVI